MKEPKFLYIVINFEDKRHYGAFWDFGEARKKLLEIEKREGLPEGTIRLLMLADYDIK